jgi:hypothetical protein
VAVTVLEESAGLGESDKETDPEQVVVVVVVGQEDVCQPLEQQ